MPPHFRFPVLNLLLVLLLAACSKSEEPAAPAPKPAPVTIDLSPAIKVGQKFSYTADISEEAKQDLTISTLPPQNQDSKSVVHIEGETEVLSVNSKGGVQKVAFTIKNLTATQDGKPLADLPTPGTKIVGEIKGKDTIVTIDGKPAPDEVASAIGGALPLDDPFHTDQELSGPTKPVSVGDTWSINSAATIDLFKEEMDAELSDIKSTMKLDSLKGNGDGQEASVSGNFSATVKPQGLPQGVTLDTASATGTLSGNFPATTTKGTLTETKALSLRIDALVEQQGMQVKLSVTKDQKWSGSATFHP